MTEPQILVTSVPERTFDVGRAIQVAAAARGISVLRLGTEIMRRQMGRQRLSPQEYFLHGAHRPDLTDDERGMFVGDVLGFAMSDALRTKRGRSLTGIFRDKVFCDLVLRSFGFPIPRIQAYVGPPRGRLPFLVLADRADLARFLNHEAQMPIFGKPFAGSMSLGAVSIVDRPAEGWLKLGDERQVLTAHFVDEVFRHFPQGYIFQDMLLPDPSSVPLAGLVLATARIVTLRVGGQITVMYGGIKWPGKGAMVDGAASLNSIEASVDVESGQIIRVQDPRRLGGSTLTVSPVDNAPMVGQKAPQWEAAKALAIAVHEAFPDQPIFGGDIGLTPDGPVLIELNSRPGMSFYQKTMARGLWNPDLAPRFTEALAEAGHRKPTRQMPLPWPVRA